MGKAGGPESRSDARTTRRPLALAAAAFAPPAAAQAPPPTLQFDRPCDAGEQPMPFTGGGYTPSGPVQVTASNPAGPRGLFDVTADAAGAIAGTPAATEDTLLIESENRATIIATASDRTRADAGAEPPESQFAAAQFTFYPLGRLLSGPLPPGAQGRGGGLWLGVRHRPHGVVPVPQGPQAHPLGEGRPAGRRVRRHRQGHPRAARAEARLIPARA